MGSRFRFEVEVELEHRQGKFESRDTLSELIREALDEANPSDVQGDNDGEYEVTDWSVVDVSA